LCENGKQLISHHRLIAKDLTMKTYSIAHLLVRIQCSRQLATASSRCWDDEETL